MYFENKISMKTIGVQPKAGQPITDGPIAHVYGSARNYLVGSSNYGTFTKFRGDFEAVNLATGESYRSQNLLLPEIASGLLIAALHAAGAKHGTAKTASTQEEPGEPATSPVEFAIEIGLRKTKSDKPGGAGYEFTLRPLIEAKDSDPLAALRTAVEKHKALPAPQTEKKTKR